MALVFVGLPGVVLALLVRFTISEPLRGVSANARPAQPTPTLWQVYALLWSRRRARR